MSSDSQFLGFFPSFLFALGFDIENDEFFHLLSNVNAEFFHAYLPIE